MSLPGHESNQASTSAGQDMAARSYIQALILIGATAVGIYLCYRLARPFLPALVWALALAVLFTSFHEWLEKMYDN